MSNDQPPKPNADALAKNLKASLAERRPRPWKPVLVVIVLASLTLVGLWFWLKPRPRTEPWQVLAFDSLVTPDETPRARAQLFVTTADGAVPRPSGQTIVLFEQMNADPRRLSVKSDANGVASADWPIQGGSIAEFYGQHLDDDRRQVSLAVRGLLFVWPKNAPLLIVDADEEFDAQALSTLSKAGEEGWHVVYLATAATTAPDFARAIAWRDDNPKLPRGPMLGQDFYPSDKPQESTRRDTLKSLKDRFNGPMLALVNSADAAQTCKEVGVPALRIGAAPEGVPWTDVPVRLK